MRTSGCSDTVARVHGVSLHPEVRIVGVP